MTNSPLSLLNAVSLFRMLHKIGISLGEARCAEGVLNERLQDKRFC